MALSGTRLGDAIKAGIDGVGDPTDRDALFRAMGEAIVKEINTNAQVSTTVAVTSVAGVTVGVGISGPGTGTGTGTIL